jgi:CRISPR type III-A-associated protein Csm2
MSTHRPNQQRQGQRQQSQQHGIEWPSDSVLSTIIAGDPVESAKATDEWGRKIGKALKQHLKAAQIRNIFGKVRQIEMYWEATEPRNRTALRDLILLKPKLRYQAERKNEVKDLAELLTKMIDQIDNRDKFQRFVDFFAFENTLRRFIESYEKFIQMFDDGTVYISKQVDIYDLLERDDEAELLGLVEEDRVTTYRSKDFVSTFRDDLMFDLELLREIQDLWQDITDDPKLKQFVTELRQHELLKNKKVIIFTESSETAEYLYGNLEQEFPGRVLAFSSGGGMVQGASISKPVARSLVQENYDPRQRNHKNDIRILISTDVLAEGINLHRSNIVINYDLPWNPTRVLQRVGRVNRIGTEHRNIYIFNFFPTAQSSRHLHLEDNVKTKIQAFHDMLGEDARYLTEEEAITQHELFGDRLYKRLNTKETYEGEQEERSELEYLQEIRDIRDKNPELFEKIKRLPKKARTGRKLPEATAAHLEMIAEEQVVTFFRKGILKKFFLASEQGALELTFLDAVDLLRVEDKGERENKKDRIAIPRHFYDLLHQNKEAFAAAVSAADDDLKPAKGGRSNEAIVIKLLKQLDRTQRLTDDDEAYLKAVLNAFENGVIPSKTSKSIKDTIEKEKTLDAVRVLSILRTVVPDNILYVQPDTRQISKPNEVILSAYLLAQSE